MNKRVYAVKPLYGESSPVSECALWCRLNSLYLRESSNIISPDKTANKENMPSNRKQSVVYQKKPNQLYWQSEKMTARNDIYATNLFNKILHFEDLKYPLS